MKPLEFIFMLLSKFINFPPGRLTTLQDQSAAWLDENRNKDNFISKVIAKTDLWYVQVLLAILFLFSVKAVSNWLYSSSTDDVLVDEEEDDIPVNSSQKFNLN